MSRWPWHTVGQVNKKSLSQLVRGVQFLLFCIMAQKKEEGRRSQLEQRAVGCVGTVAVANDLIKVYCDEIIAKIYEAIPRTRETEEIEKMSCILRQCTNVCEKHYPDNIDRLHDLSNKCFEWMMYRGYCNAGRVCLAMMSNLIKVDHRAFWSIRNRFQLSVDDLVKIILQVPETVQYLRENDLTVFAKADLAVLDCYSDEQIAQLPEEFHIGPKPCR